MESHAEWDGKVDFNKAVDAKAMEILRSEWIQQAHRSEPIKPADEHAAGANTNLNSIKKADDTGSNKLAADVGGAIMGVASGAVAEALLRNAPVPPLAKAGIAAAVGLATGGFVNNTIEGRDALSKEGYYRNALMGAVGYMAYRGYMLNTPNELENMLGSKLGWSAEQIGSYSRNATGGFLLGSGYESVRYLAGDKPFLTPGRPVTGSNLAEDTFKAAVDVVMAGAMTSGFIQLTQFGSTSILRNLEKPVPKIPVGKIDPRKFPGMID